MKVFTKISLIVAAVALGLGVLGVGIGLLMGANTGDLREMGIYISPHQVELSGVITEVGREIKDEIRDEIHEEVRDSVHVYHEAGTARGEHGYRHHLEGIERLDVEVQNAEIIIYATQDLDELQYYTDKGKDIAKVDGNTLKLEDRSSSKDRILLELYIPEGVLREIEIEATAGVITADRIIADSVSVEVDAASVQIDELLVSKEADLHVDAGEMIIGYYGGPKLDVDCAVGSIMVVCEGSVDDYNYEMECGMGQIMLNEENYSGIGEKIHIQNESNKLIEAECSMGEIILEFPNSI